MTEKDITLRIIEYEKDISDLDKDKIQKEIAVNLFAIFLQLREIEETLSSLGEA